MRYGEMTALVAVSMPLAGCDDTPAFMDCRRMPPSVRRVHAKLEAASAIPDIELASSPKKLIARALELGPPANVLKACDARYK